MFPPLGLFQDVPCPEGTNCALLVCLFSHEGATQKAAEQEPVEEGHVHKKRKVELVERPEKSTRPDVQTGRGRGSTTTGSSRVRPAEKPAEPAKPAESPAEKTPENPGTRNNRKESLNPRMLTKAPASHGVRLSILTKLHSAMTAQNAKMAENKTEQTQSLVLTPNELVTMALDEEEKAAKDHANVYSNVIKLRIVRLSKMSPEDWANEVKTHLNARYYKIEPSRDPPTNAKPRALNTGLGAKEEIAMASKLVTPLEGLEQYGYVTRAPTQQEIAGAIKGVELSKGWEQCCRCGGRFQVWPGRRQEDGALTSGGPCTHHPGKPMYPPRTQTEHITGPKEAYYPCCNEGLSVSAGCTKSDTHVFKVSEAKRLASVLQFAKTPAAAMQSGSHRPPVSFDCEMGYTALGMELIRLTAVRWPDGQVLIDVLVRPIGEVLDLNSRFSGVFPEHYANAVPYSPDRSGSGSGSTLQVVDSPAAARHLLFEYLHPETPLIGHAIDNDLNACRIIHPTVIDTVLLYPAPRGGLPNRMSLRTLARRHLDRDIQTAGERGHDSKEDAVATGDLVRLKAAELWKDLRSKGIA